MSMYSKCPKVKYREMGSGQFVDIKFILNVTINDGVERHQILDTCESIYPLILGIRTRNTTIEIETNDVETAEALNIGTSLGKYYEIQIIGEDAKPGGTKTLTITCSPVVINTTNLSLPGQELGKYSLSCQVAYDGSNQPQFTIVVN